MHGFNDLSPGLFGGAQITCLKTTGLKQFLEQFPCQKNNRRAAGVCVYSGAKQTHVEGMHIHTVGR